MSETRMIYFVVVCGTPAGVARIAPRLLGSLDATRLIDGERIERTGAGGEWAAAAIAEPDPLCATRLASDGDALVVFNGPAIATDGDQSGLAQQLLHAYRSSGSEAVAARLDGTYNFVGVARGTGLRAFHDFSGLYPLYWYQGDDFAVFSNRSQSVAHAVGSRGWNTDALAWVAGHGGNLVDEHMPARDVRYLPPGYAAGADAGSGHVRIERSSTWIWPPPSDDLGRDNLSPGEWDDITDSLVAHVRALPRIEGLRLGISGGKDSRLCLALAKAAGLDDRITTYTSGGPDKPEVRVAREVAIAAGFVHDDKSRPEAQPQPAKRPVGGIWQRLQQNITRYEAVVGAWSALQNPTDPPFVNIKGWGGELYRRGNEKDFRKTRSLRIDELQASFVKSHRGMDLLGIMRPERAAQHAAWLSDWVARNAEHVRSDLLPEKFYVDFRLGHWSGPNLQCAPRRVNINPLALRLGAMKNFELSQRARTAERFHFEVMRRAAPELVALPFFVDVWSRDIVAGSPIALPTVSYAGRALARARRPLGAARRTLAPWTLGRRTNLNRGWTLLAKERKAIQDLFEAAARETDMGAVYDLDRLRNLVRGDRTIGGRSASDQMVNAIGVALTLLGRAEPAV
jgi:hypothetical protein